MACPHHRNLCAFPEPDPSRCEFCHCDWSKITAPATRVTVRSGMSRPTRGKPSVPIVVEDVAYMHGYGETPLTHLWSHAVDTARNEKSRTATRKVAA